SPNGDNGEARPARMHTVGCQQPPLPENNGFSDELLEERARPAYHTREHRPLPTSSAGAATAARWSIRGGRLPGQCALVCNVTSLASYTTARYSSAPRSGSMVVANCPLTPPVAVSTAKASPRLGAKLSGARAVRAPSNPAVPPTWSRSKSPPIPSPR